MARTPRYTPAHGTPAPHALDELRERLTAHDEAQRTAHAAKGVAELSAQQAFELGGEVASLKTVVTGLSSRVDLVLVQLGALTAIRPLDRWLLRVYLATVSGAVLHGVYRAITGAM